MIKIIFFLFFFKKYDKLYKIFNNYIIMLWPEWLNQNNYLVPKNEKAPTLNDDKLNFLRNNPQTSEQIISVEEKWELEFLDTIVDTQQELNSLKDTLDLNLNKIIWLTLKNWQNNFVSNEWIITNINKNIKLEDILVLWQKFSIYDPNTDETRNVITWEWEDWKMTYIFEWTNQKVEIANSMVLKMYDKNINYTENLEWVDWYKPPVLSAPSYKSSRWITLCSRTARENLSKLWISNPKQWASAKDSFNMYSWEPVDFPPKDPNAKLVDLYCDASPKNKIYWHRSVWVKINWEWFVLDPYYWWGSRNPMPAEKYVSMMQWKWRNFWWWHIVA